MLTVCDAVVRLCWCMCLYRNLIAAYYDELPYSGDGLMHAANPWSGHYEVDQVIWATAHTTQFTQPGWRYLAHGSGVGQLTSGGTYVALTDGKGALTIVVEAMTKEISDCVHGPAPPGNITGEYVSFRLTGAFDTIKSLYVWQSQFDQPSTQWFMSEGSFAVENGVVTINLQPNTIWTLSTINGFRGNHTAPPSPLPFPFPYADNFDSHTLHSQAAYFTDQSGSYEVVQAADSARGKVLRQMMPELPVSWCGETPLAYSIMGSHDWRNVNVTADVLIEVNGTAFIAADVTDGGCLNGLGSDGFTFAISTSGNWQISNDTGLNHTLATGKLAVTAGVWYRLSIVVDGDLLSAYVDGNQVSMISVGDKWNSGWAAIGSSYDFVQYDNFSVDKPSRASAKPTNARRQRRVAETKIVQE